MSVKVTDLCFVFVFQVKSLKERIEQEKGEEHFPFAGQKLIYAGRMCGLLCKNPLLNLFFKNSVAFFIYRFLNCS